MSSFNDFDLLLSLRETLQEKGFKTPTEIQRRTLPTLLDGRSVVGVAQTGSGKTLAYVLPILHLVKNLENAGDKIQEEGQPRAVVVVPSRELGEQVAKVFKIFTHHTRVRVRTVLGGNKEIAKKTVEGMFEVLVATPGRLVQYLDRKKVYLHDTRFLVFDEADQMLDDGFLPAAKRIARECERDRQVALFSATVSSEVQELINDLYEDAKVIRADNSNTLPDTLITENLTVVNGKRLPLLQKLAEEKVTGGTIVFVNTRAQVDVVAEELKTLGKLCVVYRGEMEKTERKKNLKNFREGQVDFLVATDLASRGLDVEHVGRVINYHMPQVLDNYLHRVGRTARAGRSGKVINFVTERDAQIMSQVEALSAK